MIMRVFSLLQTQMVAYLELYAQHHGLDQYIRFSWLSFPCVQFLNRLASKTLCFPSIGHMILRRAVVGWYVGRMKLAQNMRSYLNAFCLLKATMQNRRKCSSRDRRTSRAESFTRTTTRKVVILRTKQATMMAKIGH